MRKPTSWDAFFLPQEWHCCLVGENTREGRSAFCSLEGLIANELLSLSHFRNQKAACPQPSGVPSPLSCYMLEIRLFWMKTLVNINKVDKCCLLELINNSIDAREGSRTLVSGIPQ